MRGAFRVRLAAIGAMVLVAGGLVGQPAGERPRPPLYAPGVAVHPDGSVGLVAPGVALIAGSRVVDAGAGATRAAEHQRAWLAGGRVPTVPELAHSDLVETALLDLHVLTKPYGLTVAAWVGPWRYVWPRDSAFVASAFARTGHLTEAEGLLDFLARVQPPDGVFQARYRPDGSVPDHRGRQLDGTGWALWGLREVATQQPGAAERRRLVERHRSLLDRSVAAIAAQTADGQHLPGASADYWEVRERSVTLATCAPLLAGLRAASTLYGDLGDHGAAERATALGDRFERRVLDAFGPTGFPRRLGGAARTVDLGISLLLPPFAGVVDPAVTAAWQRAPQYLTRPAGGLAPGGSWPRDGVSWTPTTATWAVTAGCRDRDQAVRHVQWLDRHRTSIGALPEKVLADGSPASVAPLAWTAAAVVIAVDLLERGCQPSITTRSPIPHKAADPQGR